MTATSTTNPYLRTKVMTATPEELRLMLLDGAIKFLNQGLEGIETRDYEASFNGITRCQKIVMELLNALRPEHDPVLCQRLSGLYTFMYMQLVKACTERDADVGREVLGLLEYERTTWKMLIEQQSAESAAPDSGASVSVHG